MCRTPPARVELFNQGTRRHVSAAACGPYRSAEASLASELSKLSSG